MLITGTKSLVQLTPMAVALELAEACKVAYCDETTMTRVLRASGWEPFVFFRKQAAIGGKADEYTREWGFAARGKGAMILIFRGANSLAEWLAQGALERAPIAQGTVHAGMLAEVEMLRPMLRQTTDAAAAEGLPIFCAGHALGGALALLTALSLPNDSHLCTFGQPRVLDEQAATAVNAAFGDRYLRLVNKDDVVPRLPPDFVHAGQFYHFDATGALQSPSSRGADAEAAALSAADFQRYKARIIDIQREINAGQSDADVPVSTNVLFTASVEGMIDGILNHRIDRYIDSLRTWTRRERAAVGEEIETVDDTAPLAFRLATGDKPVDLSPEAPAAPAASDSAASKNVVIDHSVGVPRAAFRGATSSAQPSERIPTAPAKDGEAGAKSSERELGPPFFKTLVNGAYIPASSTNPARIPAVLTVHNDWQPPAGLRVLSRFGQTATVLMTADQHDQLARDGQVSEIEISRDAGMPNLSHSIPFTHGDKVHAPNTGEEGDQCIFGLIDTGIDILHDAFSDGQGGTRIRAIWHQADQSGPSPHKVDPKHFSQDYGTLYLSDELNKIVRGAHERGDPVSSFLRDNWNLTSSGHGTHVASIGAGGLFGNIPGGMAPKAPIVAVIPNLRTDPGNPVSLGYSLTHVDAIAFLGAVANASTAVMADSLPMVVNVSLGMNAGPHDGKTPLEVAFTMVTADGTHRGLAIVKSAGNEADHGGHCRITATEGASATIAWTSSAAERDADYFEVWFSDLDDLAFRLRPPRVTADAATPDISVDRTPANRVKLVRFGGNAIQLRLVPGTGHGNQLVIEIKSDGQPIMTGRWELDVLGRDVATPEGAVDAWMERIDGLPTQFLTADGDYTISIPGTAETVICVGASDCGTQYARICPFSSRGLTRDGLLKPDITAPGLSIEAACAGKQDKAASCPMSGTSMAAPHVAGAIALVMSRRHKDAKHDASLRQFTAKQLRDGLIRTARDRKHHRRDWGYGKLDAEAFFAHMLTLP